MPKTYIKIYPYNFIFSIYLNRYFKPYPQYLNLKLNLK
jgi:hypothetical protein